MTHIPFRDEINDHMFGVVGPQQVVSAWVNRVGGPGSEAVEFFNRTVGPVAGININPDGSTSPINS